MSITVANSPLLGRSMPPGNRWVTELGMTAFPYLADHRLQGMTVLPGSAYLEMALAAVNAIQGHTPSTIEDVAFERAFIIPSEGTRKLHIAVAIGADHSWEFAATDAENLIYHARARLLNASAHTGSLADRLRPEDPAWRKGTDLDGETLYQRLSALGNEFGPAFRRIERCRLGEGAAVGQLRLNPDLPRRGQLVDTTMLDTAMQVLTAATDAAGQTFLLVGCERMTLHPAAGGAQVYARMRPERNAAGDLVGDVLVVDHRGNPALEVSGVRLRCLPLPARDAGRPASAASARATMTFRVAATFTAEPLNDALSFWLETLAIPAAIQFAPYNQLFQQLLDSSSMLATNASGANVILVRAEDLARPRTNAASRGSPNPAALLGNRPRFTVPGIGEIAHLAHYETEFLYDEIFLRKAYLRHGIELDDGACVFDVGANIGMFTLFVHSRCSDAKIYAFEPCQPVFDVLRVNTAAHVPGAVVVNAGVADADAERAFTYYRHSPAFSGFAADPARDRAAVEAIVRNVLLTRLPDGSPKLDQLVRQLTRDRLESATLRCRTRTLSSVIAEYGVDRVDLLKIDAEGIEIDVFSGIQDEHWPLFRQIVVEVHSAADAKATSELLRRRGFDVVADESNELLRNTGFVQIFARRRDAASAEPRRTWAETLERNADDLIHALAVSQNTASVPCIVALCPRSAVAAHDDNVSRALDQVESRLATELADIAGTLVFTPDALQQAYPVDEYADTRADALGGIPYTSRFYAALATMIARRYMALRRPPIKAIALDCDNTLWSGVCGEVGPAGVRIDPARRALQDFVVQQHDAGTLICLCSKNRPTDVHEVFSRHVDIPLQLSHIAASRLNWDKKSANLDSLAKELCLGLDGFVFVDDDPVECAEVRANCPEALTLCLPADATKATRFLDHVWAFDRVRMTSEDRARANLYARERQRRASRHNAMTFSSFIAGLELRVTTEPCTHDEVARVAQLTARTNQFNTTTIRRSETELHQLLESGKFECVTVRVKDRFGEYGLVGATLFQVEGNALHVDSFLLSCRALGRGVEHRMLAALGEIAQARGLDTVELSFAPSGRNEPARRFLAGVGQRTRTDATRVRFTMAAEAAADLVFEPATAKSEHAPVEHAESSEQGNAPSGSLESSLYENIATNLADVNSIVTAIERGRVRRRPALREVFVGPDDDLERELASLWQRVLGVDEVGVDDNFFELGGTSLLAAHIMAELSQRFGETVPTVALFEGTTIRAVAAMMRSSEDMTGSAGQQRGQRRRGMGRLARPDARGPE